MSRKSSDRAIIKASSIAVSPASEPGTTGTRPMSIPCPSDLGPQPPRSADVPDRLGVTVDRDPHVKPAGGDEGDSRGPEGCMEPNER